MPTIAILGPGGVGGFLAAALARAGTPTTVVARKSTAELIAREGISVESVRPETGLLDEPITPTRLPETVAKKNPTISMTTAATTAATIIWEM